jgi:sterol desaturase/sphingolipid hydroxylase (fatty acid hydroxylase superfamily)
VSAPAVESSSRPRRAAIRRGLNIIVSLAAVGVSVILSPLPLIGLAVAATVVASIEVLVPRATRSAGPRRTLASFATDLTHAVGNRYLALPLVAVLLAGLGPPAAWLVPQAVRDGVSALPALVALALIFPLTDLSSYFAHRAMHRVPALWRLHAVHHSSEHLDWLATARVHPFDLAINLTAALLPAYALGLLEVHPWVAVVLFLYPFLAHANAEVPLPVLDRVIASPTFHHWHHAAAAEAHDRNFGAIFSFWDRLFGTAYEPGGLPDEYGIGDPALAGGDYTNHLLVPLGRLVPRRRMSPMDDPARSAGSDAL